MVSLSEQRSRTYYNQTPLKPQKKYQSYKFSVSHLLLPISSLYLLPFHPDSRYWCLDILFLLFYIFSSLSPVLTSRYWCMDIIFLLFYIFSSLSPSLTSRFQILVYGHSLYSLLHLLLSISFPYLQILEHPRT
uniref:Uncharacterized protein n=1 Tax=Cacopsylla melanoneura TaxID=428564 RepID=A0A8D9FC49_9HEMI